MKITRHGETFVLNYSPENTQSFSWPEFLRAEAIITKAKTFNKKLEELYGYTHDSFLLIQKELQKGNCTAFFSECVTDYCPLNRKVPQAKQCRDKALDDIVSLTKDNSSILTIEPGGMLNDLLLLDRLFHHVYQDPSEENYAFSPNHIQKVRFLHYLPSHDICQIIDDYFYLMGITLSDGETTEISWEDIYLRIYEKYPPGTTLIVNSPEDLFKKTEDPASPTPPSSTSSMGSTSTSTETPTQENSVDALLDQVDDSLRKKNEAVGREIDYQRVLWAATEFLKMTMLMDFAKKRGNIDLEIVIFENFTKFLNNGQDIDVDTVVAIDYFDENINVFYDFAALILGLVNLQTHLNIVSLVTSGANGFTTNGQIYYSLVNYTADDIGGGVELTYKLLELGKIRQQARDEYTKSIVRSKVSIPEGIRPELKWVCTTYGKDGCSFEYHPINEIENIKELKRKVVIAEEDYDTYLGVYLTSVLKSLPLYRKEVYENDYQESNNNNDNVTHQQIQKMRAAFAEIRGLFQDHLKGFTAVTSVTEVTLMRSQQDCVIS